MTELPADSIELVSPAKLNLFLLITGRRGDGYHELQTLFQLLDRGDLMRFSRRKDGELNLNTSFHSLKAEDNLILRAAKLLAQEMSNRGIQVPGTDIEIDKNLPMGGGLGGGSSNAATTLVGLNHLWQANLSQDELMSLGIQLGADVPIFVAGKSAFAEGVGEKLTPTSIEPTWYLVVDPQVSVSTAEIFSNPQLTRDSAPIKIPALAADCVRNDCQNVVEKLHPEVAKARLWLEQFGDARLTGTGACLFAQFATEADADSVLNNMPSDWNGFVAKGTDKSPTHRQLEQL